MPFEEKILYKVWTIFWYFLSHSFSVLSSWWGIILFGSLNFSMISRANYVASPWYWFRYLIFGFRGMLWQSFYPLIDKRTKGPLLLRRQKHCTFSTIHCVIWHTINKALAKIYKFAWSLTLMKDSFRSCQAENDLVISKFLIRRYLFHTIGRQSFTKTITFRYFTTFSIQYFHTKFTRFFVFVSV